ncbi:hypothetical protein jhhlp_005317 [Lomentospora prolificans]|uniref:NmrA-like domain-containing protein n=1 Tax=Lomentospora prolificans TaxID=41688 RepID=A0A2N3N7F8_9PEZI|nr:hypothetical protein jhhlp_005317 [Lomentospora prolificans]
MSKLFVVFGVTGQQGGGLINYLLQHPKFSDVYRLRGITRDPSKPAAKRLIERGVEIVQADLSDPQSLPSAVEGADVVFSVTNIWDTGDAELEEAQGKAVADAARAAGVSQFIWSSLPSINKITGGRVTNFLHFESKARVEEHVRSLGFPYTVFFWAGWYMQNAKNSVFPPHLESSEGEIVLPLAWPDNMEMAYIDIDDIGKYLAPALRDPARWNGKKVIGATAFYTAKEATDTWSRVTGKKVRYATLEELPPSSGSFIEENVYRPNPVLIEVGYFGKDGHAELERLKSQLDEELNTWESYLKKNGPWFES